ncbi:MAG: UDP-N-acetylmuramoyl-tripeptide--D-alanyl-D-alanine ligase [Cyclobacteriaceae bacterium]|jgi:UDP-N-acetylmuramoyl-tripeptide--D-alanyl-D-alanine ligase
MDNFIEFLYSKFLQSDGVSIDTRTLKPDNLFFAISGPNFNANKFANEALTKGASFAVVDDASYQTDSRIILAKNAQEALQGLAVFHRSRLRPKILGITGSNGKTTTKELINAVLSQKYIVHATPGNYNNHLGVPLTLLHIHPQVEVAIIEMGANHVGEIAQLSSFANPTHGLITNIGEAHTETFGGIEGVLRGKSELFDHLRKNGGIPFINLQDDRLAHMSNRFDGYVAFPSDDLIFEKADPYITFSLAGQSHHTKLVGEYNFENIAAAVAIGRSFDVTDEKIIEAICGYSPSNQRSQVIKKGTNTVILDAYNANPTSMTAAIKSFAQMSGYKLAILGDMNEVENEVNKHKEIGLLLESEPIDEVWLCGSKMKHAKNSKSVYFENLQDLLGHMSKTNFSDRQILIKASRSMKLEEVLNKIQ